MSQSYLPARDEDFNTWAINYSALISASPSSYGLTSSDASALAPLVASFSSALTESSDPGTRTPAKVAAKNTARAVATAAIRSLTRRIQANPNVSAEQKVELGVSVVDRVPTRIPVPSTNPLVAVTDVGSLSLSVRVVDETTPTRRGKPEGIDGVQFFSYVPTGSEQPPADLESWRFEGMTTKTSFVIGYQGADVGKTAYIRARWFNPRGEAGPLSPVITQTIAA